ncbi:hypothetical protein HanXRQr2_Chr14g0650351 [Helianthus annuus]|uniref:Uncharacterized protein n=1 Tax=Helianthus annuus TaxID=4232 RepID=A0A251SHW3_HELAN|nr:hypothetical protein HanXRQr2_Chr14g0650351 [Helianthus annuus]KAJ0840857.1 hypothetical protein HanPSC8_Chr14g0623791 [Helianthus annuus]
MLTKDLNRVAIANKANGKKSLSRQALPGEESGLSSGQAGGNTRLKRMLKRYVTTIPLRYA